MATSRTENGESNMVDSGKIHFVLGVNSLLQHFIQTKHDS